MLSLHKIPLSAKGHWCSCKLLQFKDITWDLRGSVWRWKEWPSLFSVRRGSWERLVSEMWRCEEGHPSFKNVRFPLCFLNLLLKVIAVGRLHVPGAGLWVLWWFLAPMLTASPPQMGTCHREPCSFNHSTACLLRWSLLHFCLNMQSCVWGEGMLPVLQPLSWQKEQSKGWGKQLAAAPPPPWCLGLPAYL